MLYYKASQPVPGKGDAVILYECDDQQKVLRFVTCIPATGETERVSDPVVKRLYRPELLTETSRMEFLQYWPENEASS